MILERDGASSLVCVCVCGLDQDWQWTFERRSLSFVREEPHHAGHNQTWDETSTKQSLGRMQGLGEQLGHGEGAHLTPSRKVEHVPDDPFSKVERFEMRRAGEREGKRRSKTNKRAAVAWLSRAVH